MQLHLYAQLVTCLALLVYVWTVFACGRARGRHGVKAPATSGAPEFERWFRVQQNTLEQLVLFLPSLWIFSLAVSQLWGAVLGLVFVAGRILYALSYVRRPESRGPGFTLAMTATMVLLLGGLLGVLRIMLTGLP